MSLSLLARSAVVADFDLVCDVLLSRNPFLIVGHLGFSANMEKSDLDFASLLMPVDDYSDPHTLLSSRSLLHSFFYSSIDRSFAYSDRHYSFPDTPQL